VLERAGLVTSERRGRELRFAVQPERLDTAAEAMGRVAATWDRRLERIKRLAEVAHAGQQGPGESAGGRTSRSKKRGAT
jgi:hypothetical protein